MADPNRFRGSFNPPVPNPVQQQQQQQQQPPPYHPAAFQTAPQPIFLQAPFDQQLYHPIPAAAQQYYQVSEYYHHTEPIYCDASVFVSVQPGYGSLLAYQLPPVWPAPPVVSRTRVVPGQAQFFRRFYETTWRDIVLVVDASSSMHPHWSQVRESVNWIAERACKVDPDGITVYFFSSPGKVRCFKNIRTAAEVAHLFKQVAADGSTDMAGVLRAVDAEHFDPRRNRKPTTALVLTDGEPDNADAVVLALIAMAGRVRSEEELGITFVQVGNDAKATAFLKMLDDDLEARGAAKDIVDTIKAPELGTRTFHDIVQASIYD